MGEPVSGQWLVVSGLRQIRPVTTNYSPLTTYKEVMPREQITLQCTECKRKNYTSMKNKKTMTERLELKKFCPFCRKHHPHKEIK